MFEGLGIGIDHEARQLRPADRGYPIKLVVGAGRVADQRVDFGWAKVTLVESDVILPIEASVLERNLKEVPYRYPLTSREYVIVRLVDLQHSPHALDVLRGVAP